MDHRRERNAQSAEPLTEAGKISRRAMVAGTLATTAMAAALPLSNSAYAEAPNPRPHEDMVAFLLLSEALTNVDRHTLAPEFPNNEPSEILDADPGVDPINIKDEYFKWINDHDTTRSFVKLLQIAKDNRKPPLTGIIAKVNGSDDDTKYLARSIVLLWYLGSWYDPADLKKFHDSPQLLKGPIPSEVVGAKAYTQGLVWQIAGAHPMGYSNLQFGYWSRDPRDPNGLNGNPVPLFSPSKS
jgi:hypothetical protein